MIFCAPGIELYYQKYGRGTPLILLHGNGETHNIFDKALPILKNHFTVYAIDSRGHGKSSKVDELFELLSKQNNGEIGDRESGYCYEFQNISVGVYREATPEEISEMVKEAASYGTPMSDEEIEYEMKRASHWATIGVGVADYYRR